MGYVKRGRELGAQWGLYQIRWSVKTEVGVTLKLRQGGKVDIYDEKDDGQSRRGRLCKVPEAQKNLVHFQELNKACWR